MVRRRAKCIVDVTHAAIEMYKPVAPVVYQVILEPGIGQFREFESPRVRTRIYLLGTFCLCTN